MFWSGAALEALSELELSLLLLLLLELDADAAGAAGAEAKGLAGPAEPPASDVEASDASRLSLAV
jgi:hypothetical protein